MEKWLDMYGGTIGLLAWDITVAVIVPVAAAGIAALVVIRQIKQLDRHRREDRRSQAVLEMNGMLGGAVNLIARRVDGTSNVTLQDRFLLNDFYTRALALLDDEDRIVASWLNAQVQELLDRDIAAQVAAGVDPRIKAMQEASNHIQQVLLWQRRDLATRAFAH
ncbi:hypothetical protein [uncultured Microbacterium sp.]|jgi:hypothetical protein|uniref:hypothetical protein n=1 Tax=Microbacterium algeriense TaxID=2615184 RepID=UPI00259802F6|nr:hypothetical protein [uncultured Microbacterium sp.]